MCEIYQQLAELAVDFRLGGVGLLAAAYNRAALREARGPSGPDGLPPQPAAKPKS